MQTFEDRLLTVAETALRLGCSAPSVYRKIHDGELPAVRLGDGNAALRVPEAELDRWLERNRVGPPPEAA